MKPFSPWRVQQLDLGCPLPALAPEAGVGGHALFLWSGDVPLGRVDVAHAELPLPASQLRLRALEAVAPALGARLFETGFGARKYEPRPPPEPPAPLDRLLATGDLLARVRAQVARYEERAPDCSTSLIVCTRDRAPALRACLRAIMRLTPPADEVIVVDNAPRDDATRDVVAEFPGVHYLLEPVPGLSAARNAGLRRAQGELVLFTDDDVSVHPRWLLRLRAAFAEPAVWAATGLVLPAELETEPQLLFEHGYGGFGSCYRPLQFDRGFFARMRPLGVPVWRLGAGASMAFRRSALGRVGWFDPRLGAGTSGCSEDSELWYRILAAGGVLRFEPSAVVYHRHRREQQALERQIFHYLRGHTASLLVQCEKHGDLGSLRRVLLGMPAFYAKMLVSRHFGLTPPPLLGQEIAGAVAGVLYYLRAGRGSRVSAAVEAP